MFVLIPLACVYVLRFVYVHLQTAHNVRMAAVRNLDRPLLEFMQLVIRQQVTRVVRNTRRPLPLPSHVRRSLSRLGARVPYACTIRA